MNDPRGLDQLAEIMDRLRDPGGCPWDREQTFETLRGYLIEECYEVAEALDAGDLPALREELGDLLFQIVFLARLAREQGAFSLPDVVQGIADKMVRRHPHVFGSASASTSEEVLENWERIKLKEKKDASSEGETGARSVLDGVPAAMPALPRAKRLGEKAARVGFDWDGVEPVLAKVEEELGELRGAIADGNREDGQEELGDLLFSVAMLARHQGVDPEIALQAANRKFDRRFRWIEGRLRDDGTSVADVGMDRLDRLWNESKLSD